MHKGFCLMYDLSDADSSHCGKLDKCVNCGVYKYGTRIYPVYYSNTPHDATNFAKFVMGQDMVQQLGVPLPDFMQKELKPLPWEVERNSLIKKECHKYDEEWRMLANCKMRTPPQQCSLTADDGASLPLEWCMATGGVVHRAAMLRTTRGCPCVCAWIHPQSGWYRRCR